MKKRYLILSVLIILGILAGIAFAKWSDYAELASGNIADGDDFLIRDVSDVTMAATGTQKRYAWLSLKTDIFALFDTEAEFDSLLFDVESETHASEHAAAGADPVTVSPSQIPVNEGQIIVGNGSNVGAATSDMPNVAIGCSTTTLSADNTMSCNKLVAEINCGEVAGIAQYRLVYMKADGELGIANGDQAAGPLGPAIGITTAACTDGNECIICQSGCIRDDDWSAWTIGGAVYLDDTAGVLTQEANATTGDIHQIVGYAYATKIINFDFAHPYMLVE